MWLLTRTLASHEFAARDRLAETFCINAYIPTYLRNIKPRYTKSMRTAVYPLLPGYLFLPTDDIALAMEAMRYHANIWPVRSDRGACLTVPDSDIAELQVRQASGEFDQLTAAQRFPIGSLVALAIAGASHEGAVAQLLGRNRARIRLATCSIVAKLDALKLVPV
jgi:hypothetical protein